MVLLNVLGWTIFPIFQGQHCQSPSPVSPQFHLLLATPVIPTPSSALAKSILLVTTPLRESPGFPCCMLRSLPRPNHLQDLPPLTPLWNSPPAPSSITFYAKMIAQAHPPAHLNSQAMLLPSLAQLLRTQNSVLWPCSLRNSPIFSSVMDSVTPVVGSPHLFGLRTDCSLYAQVKRTSATLIDGGTNICLTSNLNLLLVDVDEIPPLPISVAINREEPHIDNSCTGRGYLLLNLSDGSTHWQLSFYCKNAVEMIISPQAILASSDLFALWTQTGFKDGRPG